MALIKIVYYQERKSGADYVTVCIVKGNCWLLGSVYSFTGVDLVGVYWEGGGLELMGWKKQLQHSKLATNSIYDTKINLRSSF